MRPWPGVPVAASFVVWMPAVVRLVACVPRPRPSLCARDTGNRNVGDWRRKLYVVASRIVV